MPRVSQCRGHACGPVPVRATHRRVATRQAGDRERRARGRSGAHRGERGRPVLAWTGQDRTAQVQSAREHCDFGHRKSVTRPSTYHTVQARSPQEIAPRRGAPQPRRPPGSATAMTAASRRPINGSLCQRDHTCMHALPFVDLRRTHLPPASPLAHPSITHPPPNHPRFLGSAHGWSRPLVGHHRRRALPYVHLRRLRATPPPP